MLSNPLTGVVELAASILGIAGVIRFTWQKRVSIEERRMRYRKLSDPVRTFNPELAGQTSLFRTAQNGEPFKVMTFDDIPSLKDFAAQKAAMLDGIASAYLSWTWTDHGARVASEVVYTIPQELLNIESAFSSGMETLAHYCQRIESAIQASLPADLWSWFHASGTMQLVHAIQVKAQVLDSVDPLHFHPDNAPVDFDLSFHFPWFACILSSAREVTLLAKGDTTIGRALGHVALDTAAVAGGGFVGSGLGALAITIGAGLLDITVGFGLFSALVGLFGVGGAVVGSKVAYKIKRLPLEELSERYARQACVVSEKLRLVEEDGKAKLTEIHLKFEQKRVNLHGDLESTWRSEIEKIADEWDQRLLSMCHDAPRILETELGELRLRLENVEVQYRARRWFIWWPSGANVRLVAERQLLSQSLQVLLNAKSRLNIAHGEPRLIWEILKETATEDPFSFFVCTLVAYAESGRLAAEQIARVDAEHRRAADLQFKSLDQEREVAADRIFRWIRLTLDPVLTPLRNLERELQLEAAALGMK